MFYCFIPPGDIDGGRISVTGENFHHLKTVRHAEAGETIRVRSDRFVYEAKIETVGRDRIVALILSSEEIGAESSRPLVIAAALIQEKNFDLLLQLSVQLGVSSIQPILTRNVANHRVKQDKRERWQRIVKAACMQSRRTAVPVVEDVVEFAEAVSRYKADGKDVKNEKIRMIMPFELEDKRLIEPALFEGTSGTVVFIGPEGGWSAEEADFARENGIVTVSLGKNILRAETAALVSLTLVRRSLGEL